MAKAQVPFKELMQSISKETADDGGEVKETKTRAKIRSLAESMGESVPATGIISDAIKKKPDATAAITKAMAADIKSIRGLQQAILKEAKDTNANLVNLTKITLGGIDQNSSFMEANQELIDRLLIDRELKDDPNKTQGARSKDGKDGTGKDGDKKGAPDFSLIGALAAGLLPFIGDLKKFIEQSGMWILEIPKSIENAVIVGMNVASKVITKALAPVDSLTKIVKDALFPSRVDKPPAKNSVPDDRSPRQQTPDEGRAGKPTVEEPDGRSASAADDLEARKGSAMPDGEPRVTPETTSPRPQATEPTPPRPQVDQAPRPSSGKPTTAAPAAGKTAGKAAENTEQLVQKKFGQRLASYVGKRVAVLGAKALPVAGVGLSLWDGLAALSNGDWHRVLNNAAMGVGGVLELTGIGAPAGIALQAVGLTDAILHDVYSSVYTNEDGSPADYVGDFKNNRSLFDQRMADLGPTVKDAVQAWIGEQYKSIFNGSQGFRAQHMTNRRERPANATPPSPSYTETMPAGELNTSGMADSIDMGFSTPQPSLSTMGVPPPAPVPRITEQQVNVIGAPAGVGPGNVVINRGGDTINNVVNSGGAGGGSASAPGSPSRSPSPFDHLLYGDVYNWGF